MIPPKSAWYPIAPTGELFPLCPRCLRDWGPCSSDRGQPGKGWLRATAMGRLCAGEIPPASVSFAILVMPPFLALVPFADIIFAALRPPPQKTRCSHLLHQGPKPTGSALRWLQQELFAHLSFCLEHLSGGGSILCPGLAWQRR